MADPLSISASIAGVISLADIVFMRTRKYLSSAMNADKEVKDLAQEVLLLSGALHSLSRLAQALDTDGLKDQHIDNLRMHHIAACHATLDEVVKKLKKLEDNPTKRKLIWPFMSDRTKELLADVCRHRQYIDLALTADSLGTLLQVLSKAEEVQVNTEKMLEEAKKTREIMNRIEQDSVTKDVLNYFLPYNPQQNYEMSLSLRHPRTGLWLTRKPEFQTWLEHPDSALWLSGIPGAGKTVLTGTIIEEALRRSHENTAITFFFCDYKNTKTQTPVNVLSALASQLAIQKEEAYDYLDRYYRELHPEGALERRPGVSDLQRILKDMVKLFDHVYLIVDGLDECGNNTDNVVDCILDVIECSDNISTAFLSRDEYNIRDRLEDDFTSVEIAAHTEDITEYVTSEIEKRISNKSLRIDDLSLKGEILERLIDGAQGMFRWVACQLDFLGDCLSDKECRDALRQLPPGLNETYARILHRAPSGKESLVQMILNFIAHAKFRLNIPLLRTAISVPEVVGRHDIFDPRSVVREDSIMKLCRSLVRKSNDGCYYEFAHFSVQEFLESKMMTMPTMQQFQVSQSICDRLLAKQCINYMLFQDFASFPRDEAALLEHIRIRDEKYPFYKYAAVCWPLYARDHWTDQNLVHSAEALFHLTKRGAKSGNFTSWALCISSNLAHSLSSGRWDPENPDYCENETIEHLLRLLLPLRDMNFTPLHMAAAMALPMICSMSLKMGAKVNQITYFGSPLQCAVQGILFLFPKWRVADRVATLDWLARNNHWSSGYYRTSQPTTDVSLPTEKTVRTLLEANANYSDLRSGPFSGMKLVAVAFEALHVQHDLGALGALLRAGCTLEDWNLARFIGWCECYTVQFQGLDTHDRPRLESLIESLSSMIKTSPAHFRLCHLAWSLSIKMGCKFSEDSSIVDPGISISKDNLDSELMSTESERPYISTHAIGGREFDGAAPLHSAASAGACAVARRLLDNGADVNVFDHDQMTPLQIAINFDQNSAAGLLLWYGAALEPRDQWGSTAVMLASRRGNTELVRSLAEAGADLKAADFSSRTCLHFAAAYGHPETFAWLVSRGLQLHAKDSTGWSAVHYASFNRAFSPFLLNFGCALNDIDAMTYADPGRLMNFGPAWLNEHFDMYFRRLGPGRLRALANLEPRDSWSPLCITASIGKTSAMTNILRLGADVDFEGSPSGSALVAACISGRLESVKILVRHGAAISYVGKNGIRSAVDTARNDQVILAWLLVDRFTEQRKLADPAEADSAAHSTQNVKLWSGIVKRELVITGEAERQEDESAKGYWFRLTNVKEYWRGKVVSQSKLTQTHHPSRLIPEESVRICPGEYGMPKKET